MALLNQLYRSDSVIVYDEIFDTNEDIIISCLMTSPSGSLGNIELDNANNSLLALEDNTLLDLNLPNDFDNLTVFLMDARVPGLTGGCLFARAQ